MENGFVWIGLKEDSYLGVKFIDSQNKYVYRLKTPQNKENPDDKLSENEPNKLIETETPYIRIKNYLNVWEIPKTPTDVFNKLQYVFENPKHSINPNDDIIKVEDETITAETEDNLSSNDNQTTDDNINLDYIPLQLEKYDNDILKMLDENLTEYVGDKTNLMMLILSVVAVKCGLKSYIININGDADSGKTTLIETLFKLIPNEMIKNHNNSTLSGIIRESPQKYYYDKSLIYFGNVTDERKKQIIKIEEFIDSSYKEQNYTSTMGAKSSTDDIKNVSKIIKTFMALTKSITPYKSSNQEIRNNTSYLTVTKPTKQELIQQKRINYKENNPEFIKQHQEYIKSLKPMDIMEEYLSNKELITHIDENTKDLNYVEFERYEILYISYCIYLKISPSIESFDKFLILTPKYSILTDEEETLLKYLEKYHTDEEITLSKKHNKKFKYFSVDMFKSYRSYESKKHDNLNKLLDSMVSKGVLNKNADGLFYLE